MHHIHNAPCEMTFPDFNYAQESLVSIAAHSWTWAEPAIFLTVPSIVAELRMAAKVTCDR